jgi:hypothetical protein
VRFRSEIWKADVKNQNADLLLLRNTTAYDGLGKSLSFLRESEIPLIKVVAHSKTPRVCYEMLDLCSGAELLNAFKNQPILLCAY